MYLLMHIMLIIITFCIENILIFINSLNTFKIKVKTLIIFKSLEKNACNILCVHKTEVVISYIFFFFILKKCTNFYLTIYYGFNHY